MTARCPARLLRIVLMAVLAGLAGCPPNSTGPQGSTAPPQPHGPVGPTEPTAPARITWQRVLRPADVTDVAPAADSWRIHLIDVGTGLSVLVQGPDFSMLFDGGTSDPDETPLRVVAYLEAAIGPSGDSACTTSGRPTGTRRTIDHVVLSHPHQDHASALELVLHCYDVRNVWDSGRHVDTVFYRELLFAIAHAAAATYHTAALPPADRALTVHGATIVIPPAVTWVSFGEGDRVRLGADAGFEILHAEAKPHPDPNQNSIVLAVGLGRTRLLLTGDAESGPREDPAAPLGDVEEHLVEAFRPELRADILQVGHHGSETSSRTAFLRAVAPTLALVSAGPKLFHGVRLPDASVLAALAATGATILRTDAHDGACELRLRLGPDRGAGGCDSYVITVDARPVPADPASRGTPVLR